MQISSSGRFVFVAQWVLPAVLLLFLLFGRGLVGAPLGWMTVIGIWVSLPVLIALYVPPVLTLFDRDVRAAKATRFAYSLASWVLWVALVVAALALVDGGDTGEVGSALTVWTGGAISDDASMALMLAAGGVAIVAHLVALVLAIAGIVRSRVARPAETAETAAVAA